MKTEIEFDKSRKAELKFKRLNVKIVQEDSVEKPEWIKIKVKHDPKVAEVKQLLRQYKLHSVCEEASCPNLNECFSHGTATFMIMGDICTRRCAFCDVAHGKPRQLDLDEPKNLATALSHLNLKYIVITSVDRDDLSDTGASHFANCIKEIREHCPSTKIEILVPDFRNKLDIAVPILTATPPDVFNHNIETTERLYKKIRPGSVYAGSLTLLKLFKEANPNVPTKSGLMVGLGEELDEVKQVISDLRAHNVDMVTIGQYLQPSKHHAPVKKYYTADEFDEIKTFAVKLGFSNVASGTFVRSSYHADLQAQGKVIE